MKWLSRFFRKDQSTPAAPTTLHRGPDGVYVLRITGVLNKATVDRIEAVGSDDFARGARDLKVLIVLAGFQGWNRSDDWSDIEFFARQEKNIARIAVVGDVRWETETLMFLGAHRRKGEVRYFAPSEESRARAWLSE